jgi:diacylglycerol kinase family enzyme
MPGRPSKAQKRKVLLIVNPAAGTRKGFSPEDLARLIRSHGVEVDCRVERHASEVAAEASPGEYDRVVAAGGDGTVRAVACATTLPVAVLPAGTSNSVARSLGIPLDMRAAARVAATGRVGDIDLGVAEGPNLREPKMTFLLCASAGFDAEAARRYESRRRRRGPEGRGVLRSGRRGSILAYAMVATVTGLNFDHREVRATVDGRPLASGKMVIVSNMRHYAGWLKPAPGAVPTDGLLDVVAIRSYGVAGLAAAGVCALLARQQRPSRARVEKLTSVRLESDYDVPVQIDGEPVGGLPIDLRVAAGALRMVTGP